MKDPCLINSASHETMLLSLDNVRLSQCLSKSMAVE